jgi:TRAP-type mannitol/chloroaromatic compound transport system permease small subunit
MSLLEKLSGLVRFVAAAAACILIPAQVVVSLVYVLGRRFLLVPVTALQELEWHFFFALVFLTLGAALLADRHVRIDILRQRISIRARARIEIAGFVIGLLPFCLAVVYFGSLAAWDSYLVGEASAAALGLPWRWVVKSMVPIGGVLLLAAGVVVTARNVATLRDASGPDGPSDSFRRNWR